MNRDSRTKGGIGPVIFLDFRRRCQTSRHSRTTCFTRRRKLPPRVTTEDGARRRLRLLGLRCIVAFARNFSKFQGFPLRKSPAISSFSRTLCPRAPPGWLQGLVRGGTDAQDPRRQ